MLFLSLEQVGQIDCQLNLIVLDLPVGFVVNSLVLEGVLVSEATQDEVLLCLLVEEHLNADVSILYPAVDECEEKFVAVKLL